MNFMFKNNIYGVFFYIFKNIEEKSMVVTILKQMCLEQPHLR